MTGAEVEQSYSSRGRLTVLVVILLSSWLIPQMATACAVCYGDVDSPMTAGMNNGILVLLAVIAAVQIGFVALFVSIRQRSRREQRRKSRFHLIQRGAA